LGEKTPRISSAALAIGGGALLGFAAGFVESLVRAFQYDYYFNTGRAFLSFLLIPGAAYALGGALLALLIVVVGRLLRRRRIVPAAFSVVAASLVLVHQATFLENEYPGSPGGGIRTAALVVATIVVFAIAWRVASSISERAPGGLRFPLRLLITSVVSMGAAAAVTAFLFFGMGGSGAGRPGGIVGPRQPLNVLLITIDTLRADHLGCYGYQSPGGKPDADAASVSPRLDQLAREGVLFENAVCTAIVTDPSHASILTSLYPGEHGVTGNGICLRSDVTTLAEVLSEGGYQTGAAVSVSHLASDRSGLSQGFSDYYDHGWQERFRYHAAHPPVIGLRGGRRNVGRERGAFDTNAVAGKWLGKRSDQPFFLWVHYFDPHMPYRSHEEPWRTLEVVDREHMADMAGAELRKLQSLGVELYDGEITLVDTAIGALVDRLEHLGLLENTLVVVTADHGEHMHEERLDPLLWFSHADVYEEASRVPLIVWRPGLLAPRTVGEQVSSMDIGPTILELLGVDAAWSVSGRSFLPLLEGKAWNETPLVIESNPHSLADGRALRAGQWKLIEREDGRRELYDLLADPLEVTSVSAGSVERVRALSDELARIVTGWAPLPEPAPLDERMREDLRALGYVN